MSADREYLEQRIMSASPYELHAITVDEALRHAIVAEQALIEKDFDLSYSAITTSRGLVGELIAGVRGDIAPDLDPALIDNLRGLFLFAHRRLTQADLNRNPEFVRDAIHVLRLHKETWEQLGAKLQSEGYPIHSSERNVRNGWNAMA